MTRQNFFYLRYSGICMKEIHLTKYRYLLFLRLSLIIWCITLYPLITKLELFNRSSVSHHVSQLRKFILEIYKTVFSFWWQKIYSINGRNVFEEVKGAFSGLRKFLATESPLKMTNNVFDFALKALFVLKIFKFLSWLFGHVEKWLYRKVKVNYKIYITNWIISNFNTHIAQNLKK